MIKGLEYLSCKERLRVLGLGGLVHFINVSRQEDVKKIEPGFSQWWPVRGQEATGQAEIQENPP